VKELWDGPQADIEIVAFSPLADDPRILARTSRAGFKRPFIWNPLTAERSELECDDLPGEIVRDWSPPPLLPARLVPKPQRLHQRYGGDPIIFHLQGQAFSRRLFVGGMDYQTDQRPDVHAVLMQLESLSAEGALNRVREYHPWARPDSQHWLSLRWLAHTTQRILHAAQH